MKLKSFQACALLALLSSILSSCGTAGDVVNPTISEMDRQDVQWGLPARQPKGTPRRNNAPQELLSTAPIQAPVYNPAPAPAAIAPAPAPAAAPTTPVFIDPALR